jgi:hypothetical protein
MNTTQLSSTGKRILVFSDVHQDARKLEYILNKENYDIAVCLGDWFDSFDYDSIQDIEDTCTLLKKKVGETNFFTLFGNHDLHYLYSNQYAICSGYTIGKDNAISDSLGNFRDYVKAKFKWFIWIDDFLCSHAGIHTYHLSPMTELTKQGITAWLEQQAHYAEGCLINGSKHWFYAAGYARGGSMTKGGITWLDFDIEFEPISEIKQLVGHTPHKQILNHISDGNINLAECDNLDIDCQLNEYLIISDGKIEIKKYRDL